MNNSLSNYSGSRGVVNNSLSNYSGSRGVVNNSLSNYSGSRGVVIGHNGCHVDRIRVTRGVGEGCAGLGSGLMRTAWGDYQL